MSLFDSSSSGNKYTITRDYLEGTTVEHWRAYYNGKEIPGVSPYRSKEEAVAVISQHKGMLGAIPKLVTEHYDENGELTWTNLSLMKDLSLKRTEIKTPDVKNGPDWPTIVLLLVLAIVTGGTLGCLM